MDSHSNDENAKPPLEVEDLEKGGGEGGGPVSVGEGKGSPSKTFTTPTDAIDGGIPHSILKNQESHELQERNGGGGGGGGVVLQKDTSPAAASDDSGKSRRRKKKKPRKKLVPIWRLFSYAKWPDVLMIMLGAVSAVLAGTAIPLHMLMFGEVINNFVYHSVAEDIISSMQMVNGTPTPPSVMATESPLNMSQANSSSLYFCDIVATALDSSLLEVYLEGFDPDGTLEREIRRYSLYYVGLACGALLFTFLSTLLWNLSAYRQIRRLRLAFYGSILRQEMGWFDVHNPATLNTRLQDDVEKIQSGIGDKVAVFLQYFSTFLTGFIVGYSINWKLALVLTTMLPLLTAIGATLARIIATFTVREQTAYASAGAVAEEVLSSIRTVAAFGGEDKEAERYNRQLKKARTVGIKKGFFSSTVTGMLYFVMFSLFALGFWYGSTLILDCDVTAGEVVTVLFAILIGSFSLGNALPEFETFATALGAATVVFEIIDRKPVIDSNSDAGTTPEGVQGNIEFSNVIFRYPSRPDTQVLNGLDLKVTPGQTVALVGSSGCGKSTVVQLLQRLYDCNAGLVTLDGHDIRELNVKWLRRHIGVVSQEPVLFNTTIAENIRYGKEGASMEEITAAAKMANAHDFISILPDGYDTHVGERGVQMSGGQKQRIAIARALVKDPKILLLDEATSALDTESERVVQEALDRAREGRTTIVIAHRLSTVQTADVIASIDHGCVVEMGTHSQLMDNEGLYFELVTAQTIAEEEDKEEESDETLAGFRVALKRSHSRSHQNDSTSSGRQPSYGRQASTASHESSAFRRQGSRESRERSLSEGGGGEREGEEGGAEGEGEGEGEGEPEIVTETQEVFLDVMKSISLENIPGAAHPSPYTTRKSLKSASDKNVRFRPSNKNEEARIGPGRRKSSLRALFATSKQGGGGKGGEEGEGEGEEEEVSKIRWQELFKLNIPDLPFVLVGVIGSAIIGSLFPLMAILFSDVLEVFGNNDTDVIRREASKLSLYYVALAAGAALTNFVTSLNLAVAGERLTKRLRYRTFKSMLKQEIAWFDQHSHSTGVLTTRLAVDASEVKGATGIRLGIVFQLIAGFIVAVIIAVTASWELTLLLAFCFPIYASVGYFQLRIIRGRTEKNKALVEQSGSTAVESIDNIRTVASLAVEPRFYRQYYEQLKYPLRSSVRGVFVSAFVFALAQAMLFFIFAAGYSFGAFLVVENRATYDNIFRVFSAIVFTALSVGRASSLAPDGSRAKISAARILGLLGRKPTIDVTDPDGLKLGKASGDLAVRDAFFTYLSRPDVKVLQGLSLSVQPGKTLALVGPSGCGKSTVVSLIERFYDPVAGSLTMDSNDTRDLNLRWLRSQIGIVSQEPVLFNASIADNIRYGANFREVSDEEVIEAAKAANIHSFIETLPQGYNTNAGSKGTQLSGGQKQRIAIARALVRDPKILLLDEATSALDTESERVVQEALDRAREGRTSIVIAHRLSTIYNSDCIAVIHKGRVFESGTHSELMAKKGAYYLLNTAQVDEN